MKQVMEQFGDVEGFLRNEGVSSVTSAKPLIDSVRCTEEGDIATCMELAVVMDC